jgi:hypothetical protein
MPFPLDQRGVPYSFQEFLETKTYPVKIGSVPMSFDSLVGYFSSVPGRHRDAELHFENTGCHPNLRSLQLSLFLSVSNLGSTPAIGMLFECIGAAGGGG